MPASGCFTCGGPMLDSDRVRILTALAAGDPIDIELAQRLAREWEITAPRRPKEAKP